MSDPMLTAARTIARELQRIRQLLELLTAPDVPAATPRPAEAGCPHPEAALVSLGMDAEGRPESECTQCRTRLP